MMLNSLRLGHFWTGGLLLIGLWSMAGPAVASPTPADVAKGYATLVHANYSDALHGAQQLHRAIQTLVKHPSAGHLEAAKQAWLQAREVYGQTEAFRFYGGPIDGEGGPEGQINAWPMDESYVDYVKGNASSGFINNPTFNITRAALIENNERGGEENIATGWHAIEFLLWGQDLSDDGPGQRPHTDYVKGVGQNAERRSAYLLEVSQLLVDDLSALAAQWAPNSAGNYRAGFEQGGLESVRKMLVGLGSLSRGELAGERLEVALFSQDQEDEHSCFSDNTHRDAVANAQGILNVWQGQYKRSDGTLLKVPSLQSLVAKKAPALASKTSQQMAASVRAAENIQAPFDREILGGADAPGPKRIRAVIDSLTKQSTLIVEAASALGIEQLTLAMP